MEMPVPLKFKFRLTFSSKMDMEIFWYYDSGKGYYELVLDPLIVTRRKRSDRPDLTMSIRPSVHISLKSKYKLQILSDLNDNWLVF